VPEEEATLRVPITPPPPPYRLPAREALYTLLALEGLPSKAAPALGACAI
jgi:hypothetical protein